MRAALIRGSDRAFVGIALVAGVGIILAVWRLQSGTAADASAVATASRGDLVVSVGGVGRIVEARASAQIALPSAAGGSAAGTGGTPAGAPAAAAGGGGGTAPADAVFPRTGGRLAKFLVAPGQNVAVGEPLALLDDGGTATGARLQAQNELATAQLELRQKRTHDPLLGVPATPEELAAGRMAVLSAQKRLAQLLGPSSSADVRTARSDLRRAQADLEALLGGTPADRADAIAIARVNVEVAQQRLDAILALPNPADVAAAELELRRAEADLAELLRGTPPPSPEVLAAARQAVIAARLKLAQVSAPPAPAEITAARLELQRSQAELRRLQAGPSPQALTAARRAVDAAQARLARILGPQPRPDVAAARLDFRRAEADLAVLRARGGPATEFDIGLARLRVEAARARLALARFDERQLTVRSPSDGTVTGLLTVPGAPVDASTPVATVTGLDRFAVSVDLSEFDVAQVKRGMRAMVSVDALGGKSFGGKVLFAALTGNDSGGIVTFPVRVSLQRAAGLRPGMNVSVRIIVAERRDVVQVPLEAVARDDEDRPFATVVTEDGETTRRLVLGLANNKSVEIVKGLKAGEQVILAEAPEEGGGEE